ncbi:MAG: hypothetical protein JW937_06865 [Candidatus Omnitrophica bacterium]|nr:hypothetical protein [Candidatus Omnitrophota bacterium]
MYSLFRRTLVFGLAVTCALGLSTGARAVENQDFDQEAFQKQMEAASQEMAAAFAALGQGLAQVAGAPQAGTPVQTVGISELKSVLPESFGAYKKTSSSGDRNSAMNIRSTVVQAVYESPDGKQINAEVTDIGTFRGMGAYAAGMMQNWDSESETDDSYEKTVAWKDRKAREEYNRSSKYGNFQTTAGNGRFWVEFSGEVENVQDFHQGMDAVNISQLDQWENYGLEQ